MAKAKTSITTENPSGSAADAAAKEQRTEMSLSDLHPFEGHPFKVLDDELMEQTVESIKQIGVVSPLIVRPDPEGGFEILSGHRRLHAAQLAGLETVPVIVKEMDDDAAIIFMLLLFVIGAAGVGGYLYVKMKGVKPASKKNQPDPDADYHDEDEDVLQLPEDDGDEGEEVDVNEDYEAESDDDPV